MIDPSAVGRSFTPTTAQVEPGRLRYFLNTIGDRNPVFREAAGAQDSGLAGLPVPPTYLFCLAMLDTEGESEFLAALGIDIGRVLHGEQSFSYHAPVRVGDTLTFRQHLRSVTEKKGGALTLLVLDTHVTNQGGTHVADTTSTIVVRN